MNKLSLKKSIYILLEPSETKGSVSWYIDVFLMTLISLNIIVFMLETVKEIYAKAPAFFYYFEYISVIIFSIEYILRVWTIDLDKRYNQPFSGRLRYMGSAMALIDLCSILPFYFPLGGLDLRILRILRLFRIFRIFKFARYSKAFDILISVFRKQKEELLMSALMLFLLLIFASSIMYFLEHDAQPDVFTSIPGSMWWGIVTITTVGYGDVFPITNWGRIVAGISIVSGIAMIALPTGILVTGFMNYVSGEHSKTTESLSNCPHCGKDLNTPG